MPWGCRIDYLPTELDLHRQDAAEEPGGRVITLPKAERDVLMTACAVSTGVHGALLPDHLAEGAGPGLGFLAATVLLGAVVLAVTRLESTATLLGAVALLAGLLGSYALAITSGLPLLHPQPEPVDRLALVTKGVEAVGLLAAAHLLLRARGTRARFVPRPKGTRP